MSTIGSDFSEGTAVLFTWLADRVWGGAKRAFDWGWDQAKWNLAQDAYDAAIIEQYGRIRIFGQTTPKSLRNIFTDVYVLDTPTEFRRFSSADLSEHIWNEDRGLPFRHSERQPGEQLLNQGTKFFILGKPGAGKTTFLKRLAVREAQRGRWGKCVGKVPIFVSLKQFAEADKSLFDFIVDQFAVCHFPNAASLIEKLLESGRALVLFDGLDEVSKAEDFQFNGRGKVIDLIEKFSRQYSECHIVITCRIAATEYTFDPSFTYLEMSDFAPDQVDHFVRNWFWDEGEPEQSAALAQQMLTELAQPEHQGIRDLARSPLLLTLLCLNFVESLSFPSRRVEVYEEALDALLKKWDSTRQIRRPGLYRTLSLGRKRQMFARIAYDAFTRHEILFAQSRVEAWITAYLQHVPELPEGIDVDAEAVLNEIIAQHGIFTVQANRLYSFAHLTFQEYYAAKYISENASSDVLEILFSHMSDGKWREIFLLTASLLPDGTVFLNNFEAHLHRLLTSRPQLVTWLHWVAEQAFASQAGYRQPATRALYALELALDHALVLALDHARDRALARSLTPDRARAFEVDLAQVRTLARNRNRDLSSSLARACDLHSNIELDFDLDPARDIDVIRISSRIFNVDFDLANDMEIDLSLEWVLASIALYGPTDVSKFTLDLSRQPARTASLLAVSSIPIPPVEAPFTTWQQFGAKLKQAVDIEGVLDRLRQLSAEIHDLTGETQAAWHMEQEDVRVLVDYFRATDVFYECLQVAYVSNRHSIEDRIFMPPEASNTDRVRPKIKGRR